MLISFSNGCGPDYRMKDIKIVNANDKLGYDVYTVCDTCKEHGKCGSRDQSTVWADQHSRETGHTHFTRKACSMGLTPVLRGPQEHEPPTSSNVSESAEPNDDCLKAGMSISEVRFLLGEVGRTLSETPPHRSIEFRQSGKGANLGSKRTVTTNFDNGKLTDFSYGTWEK